MHECPDWSIMEIQLSSSGLGWGTGDLHRDVEEIAKAVQYVQNRVMSTHTDTATFRNGGKVVLMGHSTGSQDVLHYLYHQSEQNRPPIDGAILQAPVSDREGLAMFRAQDPNMQRAYKECLRLALTSEASNHDGNLSTFTLPPNLTSLLGWPRGLVSSQRFLSLTSPFSPNHPEIDDLFSSDLSTATLNKTFGAVGSSPFLNLSPNKSWGKLLLVLLSGKDEYTPPEISKEGLIERWRSALETDNAGLHTDSGVLEGASHNVKEHAGQIDLTFRVLKYLDVVVVGGVPPPIFQRLLTEKVHSEE
jgi:pimeloyl-ACP methyl ester carboxylesterase